MRAGRRWQRGAAPPPTPARSGTGSTQVVFFDVVAERTEAHTEQLRGLHLHAAGAPQRFGDVAALDLLDVRLEIESGFRENFGNEGCAGARPIAANALRQAVWQNRLRRFEGDGA